MGLTWGEKKAAPPDAFDGASDGQDTERAGEAAGDVQVECPPHTTERKLVARIDLHVVPWLCIMYLLAFLGESPSPVHDGKRHEKAPKNWPRAHTFPSPTLR